MKLTIEIDEAALKRYAKTVTTALGSLADFMTANPEIQIAVTEMMSGLRATYAGPQPRSSRAKAKRRKERG
jgi:hypothetical protein